jgi:hypothetical protein
MNRTPERQALAEAIGRRDAAREEITKLGKEVAAAAEARSESSMSFYAAEKALEEAEKNTSTSSWSTIHNQLGSILATEARRLVAAAEEDYEARRRAHAVVERELTHARSALVGGPEEAVKQATKRVIGASVEAEKLIAEFETVARSYASLFERQFCGWAYEVYQATWRAPRAA